MGRAYLAFRQSSVIKAHPNISIKPTKLHTDFAAYATEKIQVTIKGTTLVNGKNFAGLANYNPDLDATDYIFVTNKLTLDKFKPIKNASAVVCLDAGDTSHMCVICRIMGIPVIRLDDSTKLPQDQTLITIEPSTGIIWKGRKVIPDKALLSSAINVNFERLTFQASIVEPKNIAELNLVSRLNVEQFFLRSEFLWMMENENPLEFVSKHGSEYSSEWLYERIREHFNYIESKQILNFRSLDVRSDEFNIFYEARLHVERNPQIGLHGIRHLLLERALLEAEILAMSKLYVEGYCNLIFSIPFITEECELREVKSVIQTITSQPIKLGVFIETPAAVSEFEYMIPYGVYCAYIGTKDLTQLILACDRDNIAVRHIYDSKKRPVLSAIRKVTEIGVNNQVPVFLYSAATDLEFFLDSCQNVSHISMCASELLQFG